MINGLVQNITVKECTIIQWAKEIEFVPKGANAFLLELRPLRMDAKKKDAIIFLPLFLSESVFIKLSEIQLMLIFFTKYLPLLPI